MLRIVRTEDLSDRDHFATHAMKGLLNGCEITESDGDDDSINLARMAYRVADAMLEVRNYSCGTEIVEPAEPEGD